MKTIAEINAIRDRMQAEIRMRSVSGEVKVVVGMGDCGLSKGAKEVFDVLMEIADTKNLRHVKVSRTSCFGDCDLAPVVKVIKDGKEEVYNNVTKEKAVEIISAL